MGTTPTHLDLRIPLIGHPHNHKNHLRSHHHRTSQANESRFQPRNRLSFVLVHIDNPPVARISVSSDMKIIVDLDQKNQGERILAASFVNQICVW